MNGYQMDFNSELLPDPKSDLINSLKPSARASAKQTRDRSAHRMAIHMASGSQMCQEA